MTNETEKQMALTVKGQILQARAWVEKEFRRFWERKTASDFYEFQRALVTFYQDIRVYIDKTEGYEDLIENMDEELKKGQVDNQNFNVEKWLGYYNQINSALYDAGVLDVIKASGL